MHRLVLLPGLRTCDPFAPLHAREVNPVICELRRGGIAIPGAGVTTVNVRRPIMARDMAPASRRDCLFDGVPRSDSSLYLPSHWTMMLVTKGRLTCRQRSTNVWELFRFRRKPHFASPYVVRAGLKGGMGAGYFRNSSALAM